MNKPPYLRAALQRGSGVSKVTESLPPLQEESHLKVLRLLESDPSLTQRELSRALGVSLGKTNYCVRALLDKGLIKMQNFRSSDNKLSYAYLLTPAGMAAKAELTRGFLRRKMREYEHLKREIEHLKAEVGAL